MPPKALEIEKPAAPDPAAPDVRELAEGTPPPAKPAAKAKDAGPDQAGIDQFLKAQVGSDRYKDIVSKVSADDQPAPEPDEKPETPPRGPDGKFLKPGAKAPAKPAEKKAEKPAAGKKPEAPAAKPAPFKPKSQPASTPLTTEQIVTAAAEGAARALASGKGKEGAVAKDGAEAASKEPELPPEEQETVTILSKMEELNPAKYKGIATKYRQSLLALEEYAKAWEKEHAGQEFDSESPEHEDFFKKNDVDWSDLDFNKAMARIVAEDAVKGTEAKTQEKLTELERAEQLRQKQGEIVAEQNTAAVQYWQQLGEDFADVVKPDGSLNMEKINELREADPEAFALRINAAQALDVEVAEIYKLFNGLAKNDVQNNPIHRNINDFAASKEKQLAAKSTQEKLNEAGQVFVPAAQYYRMTKAEREQHWTFNARDLAYMRAADLAAVTQKRVELAEEAHKRWAKARGIVLEDPDAKPESPSAGGESRLAAVADGTPKSVPTTGQNFLQKQLHG